MKTCESCGAKKPATATHCLSCGELDSQVLHAVVVGTPSLTILVLGMLAFWGYRFWEIGWVAIGGNLRFAAMVAGGLGMAGIIFGPLWTFGIRSRKSAAILLFISVVAFLVFQMV